MQLPYKYNTFRTTEDARKSLIDHEYVTTGHNGMWTDGEGNYAQAYKNLLGTYTILQHTSSQDIYINS
jgi:hypothetical protein